MRLQHTDPTESAHQSYENAVFPHTAQSLSSLSSHELHAQRSLNVPAKLTIGTLPPLSAIDNNRDMSPRLTTQCAEQDLTHVITDPCPYVETQMCRTPHGGDSRATTPVAMNRLEDLPRFAEHNFGI